VDERPKEYIAPTWSWASLRGPITWIHQELGAERNELKYLVRVLEALSVPERSSDLFGRYCYSCLKLQGFLVTSSPNNNDTYRADNSIFRNSSSRKERSPSCGGAYTLQSLGEDSSSPALNQERLGSTPDTNEQQKLDTEYYPDLGPAYLTDSSRVSEDVAVLYLAYSAGETRRQQIFLELRRALDA
jgi:hypothetical protein